MHLLDKRAVPLIAITGDIQAFASGNLHHYLVGVLITIGYLNA
jgi:hypothetical protein